MGRGHVAGSADFTPEKRNALRIGAHLGEKKLQRDFYSELEIKCEPHFPHAATAEQTLDTIPVAEDLDRSRR
jgi:hypothetical protein